jgi:tRNA (guanine-N7-)-methyltransferase
LNRPIRSYVLRQGRTTPAQKRALEELFPKYGIPFSHEKLFSRRELVLEIGSGMGETTVEIAKAHPEVDFVAVEVHGPGVGSLLNAIEKEKLQNLRVIRHDALDVLEHMIEDESLAAIHLFFPDPWPKKRHHKRRLIQPEFATLLARKLAPGGVLRLATDWQHYAEQMLEVLSACHMLRNCATDGGYVTRPPSRQPTRFEVRGQRLGHGVWDLAFERREDVAVTSPQD